ncbi:MAG: hypothetical protein IT230_03965 [Flavobacteriales bacterium]|nr:hypothetical protein [Flavobacteriales bacterium]
MAGKGADPAGVALVIAQFVCIGALMAGSWDLRPWAWALLFAGLALLPWAAWSLGRQNLTAMPAPRTGNTLSKRGIYGWVRHPMYLGVLCCGAALALGAPAWWRWAAWAVLLGVLLVKIRLEERRLTALHPNYPELMRGVARLVPGLW